MAACCWSRVWLVLIGLLFCFFCFNDTATTEIYTLSLHDALPISPAGHAVAGGTGGLIDLAAPRQRWDRRRDLVEHEMQLVTQRGDQVRCVLRDRIRLRDVRDQRIEPVERHPGPARGRLRDPSDVAAR